MSIASARWWPRFFGCTRNNLHRFLGKKKEGNWSVLFVVIAPVEQRNQEKTSSFEKEKDPLPSIQCTGSHLRSFDGQNYGIKILIITTLTIFTGFGPQWLFFISKLEEMARRTTVHVERGGHRPNRCLFWGPSEILLFGGLKKTEKRLEKCIELKGNYVEK